MAAGKALDVKEDGQSSYLINPALVDTSCSNRNTESRTLFLLYLELFPPPLKTGKSNTGSTERKKLKNRF
jgi:hypothetical protein